jgi:hypothetical protein
MPMIAITTSNSTSVKPRRGSPLCKRFEDHINSSFSLVKLRLTWSTLTEISVHTLKASLSKRSKRRNQDLDLR